MKTLLRKIKLKIQAAILEVEAGSYKRAIDELKIILKLLDE